MTKEDPSALLKKMVEKLEKSDKRQAELEEKNDVLEKKIAEMNELLTPGDDEEEAEPAEPVDPATHEDPVHEWAKKQMTSQEEKKKKTREKFRVKSSAEIEADADKLFQEMLLDGQE